jgi:hypothetical protein
MTGQGSIGLSSSILVSKKCSKTSSRIQQSNKREWRKDNRVPTENSGSEEESDERMEKKVDNLLSKKVLDAQKNEVTCLQYPQTVSLQSISSPLENQATKTQRLQTAPLDTNGAPLAIT